MARVYRTKQGYGIDYRFPPTREGRRIREFIGPDKEEAKIMLADRLKAIRMGQNPELRKIQPKPFKETVTEFLEKHARLRKDYQTFKVNSDRLLEHFKGTLQEIGPREVEDYIQARLLTGISKSTANRERALLSCIFSFAIRREYFAGENPCRKVKAFPEPRGRTRFLTPTEATGLVGKAADHLKPLIIAGLHTGGRLSELLGLRWEAVNLAERILYFDRETTKSGKGREIPISPDLDRILREQTKRRFKGGEARDYVFTFRGRRIKGVRTAFNKARHDAGLGEDVGFHTLRHTFASWYVQNGGDLYRLQQFLGHSTIALTERYAHLGKDFLRAGVGFFGAPQEVGGHLVDDLVKSRPSSDSASA
jgi:integrase